MIINQSDIDELEKYLEDFRLYDSEGLYEHQPLEKSVEFFGERPHLLLPIGFDESLGFVNPSYIADEQDLETEEEIERAVNSLVEERKKLYGSYPEGEFDTEYLFRKPTGSWHWLNGLMNGELLFYDHESIDVHDLVKQLLILTKTPDSNPHSIWLQKMWTPNYQNQIRVSLNSSIGDLLTEIRNEQKSLQEITPRQLEEIIAELLRTKGMEIYLSPQTRDGGRDIIARGELVPGEPSIIAVEVKQKSTVGIKDICDALYANQDFPLIMVATSGRFSAGVIDEKKRNRNFYRLMLKDGLALSQWLK